MLNTLYHIEGYIFAHNHVIDYLDQYKDIKESIIKDAYNEGLISLEEHKERQKDLRFIDQHIRELKGYFDSVRQNYIMILEDQRKKIHGNN